MTPRRLAEPLGEHGAGRGAAGTALITPPPGYLCQADGTPHTAETFDWREHLAAALGTDDLEIQTQLLADSKVRRTITRTDPLLFALIYFPHHLRDKSTADRITFSDAHLGWARQALRWLRPIDQPRDGREAEFAPRATGKTTWFFLVNPMWAAAHQHLRFVAAFADTYSQAIRHLHTFRNELTTNVLIRRDYGGLVHDTRNSEMRKLIKDNESLLITANAFVFAAAGADTSTLGLKVGEKRPDMIILDDIEPDERKYSLESVKKRRGTLVDAILPLNEYARVMWVGTTTRHGGLAHQLVELADGVLEPSPDNEWIKEQRFAARRWEPIITRDDGTERSLWPAKWKIEYLQSIRHTRAYAKNFDNRPVNENGDYWSKEDITHWSTDPGTVPALPLLRKNIMVLDPNVNDKGESSDWTGIAVAGVFTDSRPGGVLVREISQVRLTGRALKDHALTVLARFPDIQRVVIECNQGYRMWLDIFADFPLPVDLVVADYPKPVRAAMALNHYQARPTRVVHERPFRSAEAQMISFPNVTHDDMVDAVSWAVRYLLEPDTISRPKGFRMTPPRPRVTEVTSYV
jgi:hypothetical protein